MARKTAEELVKNLPGAFSRRQQLLITLCRRANLATYPFPTTSKFDADEIGRRIVAVANKIIEETEQ